MNPEQPYESSLPGLDDNTKSESVETEPQLKVYTFLDYSSKDKPFPIGQPIEAVSDEKAFETFLDREHRSYGSKETDGYISMPVPTITPDSPEN